MDELKSMLQGTVPLAFRIRSLLDFLIELVEPDLRPNDMLLIRQYQPRLRPHTPGEFGFFHVVFNHSNREGDIVLFDPLIQHLLIGLRGLYGYNSYAFLLELLGLLGELSNAVLRRLLIQVQKAY
ncbi:hypothetical protein ES703_72023 [subsurface metagenome]